MAPLPKATRASSDTAATQEAYGLEPRQLVNCVLVAGKRDGEEREGQ